MRLSVLGGALLRGLLRAPGRLLRARRFLDAWNAHDADAVVALLEGGRYRDPLSDGFLEGEALATHIRALFRAFPDLRLTPDERALMVGGRTVAARYRLQGVQSGPLPGGLGIAEVAPTGRALALDATLVIDCAQSAWVVENHFDLQELAQQLDFLALLMPRRQGDYDFGAYYRLHRGNPTPPEAIGITWLQVRGGKAALEEAASVTNGVLESFAGKPGFVTGIIGAQPADEAGHGYGFTLSAWENREALEANLLPNPEHRAVVERFMKQGFSYATHSRVYELVRAKPMMIACTACGKKNNAHKAKPVCSACGGPLEAAPAYI